MAPATLTVSQVERDAVVAALESQLSHLPPDHFDARYVRNVANRLRQVTTVALLPVEVVVTIRHIRAVQMKISRDMMALEERRIRGGYDGDLDTQHRTLAVEEQTLMDVLKRLWQMLGLPVPPAPSGAP